MANKPIFFDASGRRAARLTLITWVVSLLIVAVAVGFAANLVLTPPAKNLDLPGRSVALNIAAKAQKPGLLARAERLAAQARLRRREMARQRRPANFPGRVLPSILKPQPGRALAAAVYVNWSGSQAASFASLKRNLPKLDWVIPTWITLDGPDLTFKSSLDGKNSPDKEVLDYIRQAKPGVAILPLLQNVSGEVWYGAQLQTLLADKERRTRLLDQVIDFIAANKLQGITVDFEDVPPATHKNLEIFLSEMSAAFSSHGWIIAQCAPFDQDDWPYAAYAEIVDYTMLMAYDHHDDHSKPGDIAGQNWFEKTLDKRMKVLPPDSTIIFLGSWAYNWSAGQAVAETDGFSDAMVLARDSSATVAFDQTTNNPRFSFKDGEGVQHDVWMLDAATIFNQMHDADPYRPAGYGLWRLGTEDPSVSNLLARPYNLPAPASLQHIATSRDDVDFDGYGEILRVESSPVPGERSLEIEAATGDIVDERYTVLPNNYVIRRVGQIPKLLAITFDDGPDPEWTPQILDILKQKHVTAAFFMIGSNMESHPGLVQRVLAEGHEIGNHTYTHPDLADTPLPAVALELNATQRLFQALTGRSMRMLRPPYLSDAEPTDPEEIDPLVVAQQLGYITVGANIETKDWQGLPVDQMIQFTEKLVNHPNPDVRGNIILMHDSGGDRSQTIKLLPVLIDRMRSEGYTFVPVSRLAGFSRDQVMPKLPFTVSLYADRIVFLALSYLGEIFYYSFLGAIVLGIGRLVVLCGLAVWNKLRRREIPPAATGEPALVTVLIPAFNEEKVIVSTIDRILASDYRALEVLVIDDGSMDHTAYIVSSHYMREPRVGILSVPNGGKANALNIGLKNAQGDVVVALDADTQFNADTISHLVRWFADPAVGAVAGNAKVGNRVNMITRWQALEYIVAQNLERRALSALDTLTVVPGAVGAWRKAVLLELGGFPTDTLAEDQDLTIAIQTRGYRVCFDASAIAWTEAPSTVSGLAKQRFRWAYGTLQCLWKYRRITFNPRYGELGLVALPQVWLFQILLTALAPVADLLLIWQLVGEYFNYSEHADTYTGANLKIVIVYYIIFIVVDMLAALVGFVMERREDWKLLLWLPLQRFGYRQIMYYVVLRSIATALRGPFVGWGKLERTGMVKAGRP